MGNMKRVALAALALSICVIAWAPLGAVAAKRSRRGPNPNACRNLHGHDLAPDARAKLVRRRNRYRGFDLLACALPHGRVRTLASTDHTFFTSASDATLRQVAGRFALIFESGGSQYVYSDSMSVKDLASSRGYAVSRSCWENGGECNGGNRYERAIAAFVTPSGQAAAIVATLPSLLPNPDPATPVTVLAFSATGERVQLDAGTLQEIPAAGLRVADGVVTWQHAGEVRSAPLP